MKRPILPILAGLTIVAGLLMTPLTASAQTRTRGGNAPDQAQINDAVRDVINRDRLNCEFDTARFIGRNGEGRTLYEVACQSAPGFLMLDTDPAQLVNCIANNASVAARRAEDPEAEVGAECTLERNLDVVGSIAPAINNANLGCQLEDARWIGMTQSGATRYELKCAGTDGLWIDMADDGTTSNALSCLMVNAGGGTCELTSAAEQAAWIAAIAAPSGRTCEANAGRFVGQNAEETVRYYEVGCASQVGFMVKTDGSNNFDSIIECAAATGVAGGCTLSDTSAITEATAEQYQERLGAAGISCDYLSNGAPRRETEGDQRTVIEFECADRPWGLVSFLPEASGSTESIDCLTGEVRIGGCRITTHELLTFQLNQLVALRQNVSCEVSDFRMVGRLGQDSTEGVGLAGHDVVEIKCSDGSGYVAVVAADRSGINRAQTCAVSEERGGVACEL